MTPSTTPIPFTGGIDRSQLSLRGDQSAFWDLVNFRQSATSRGTLEQTPFFSVATLTQGTYYNAGSQTEPTSSDVRMITDSHIVTDYVVRRTLANGTPSTQYQCFRQTAPSGTGLTKGCFLDLVSAAVLGMALGDSFDVVIDGATTFKWRVSGGAYTTAVPITAGGVTIVAGVVLYFLTTSGFTVNDTWSWIREDGYPIVASAMPVAQLPYLYHKDILYFIAANSRVCFSKKDYVMTVGYRPVYGSYLRFFDEHLVIVDYSATAVTASNSIRVGTIAWSDKTDYHNFFSTDTNEADSYKLPNDIPNEYITDASAGASVAAASLGAFVLNDLLFVVSKFEIYYTPALGLPNVFSFKKYVDYIGTTAVIIAHRGVYLVNNNHTAFFNGNGFTVVGAKLGSLLPYSTTLPAFGAYNFASQELILVDNTNGRLLVYQEHYGTWYSRGASFVGNVRCVRADSQTDIQLGGTALKFISEADLAAQPSFDGATGTIYTIPKITTQLFGRNLRFVKELTMAYLGFYTDAVASSTYYSTGTSLQFKLYWYVGNDGRITGSPTSTTEAVRVSSDPDGSINAVRAQGRAFALEVQLVGLVSNKPPMQAFVTSIEPSISDPTPRTPDR